MQQSKIALASEREYNKGQYSQTLEYRLALGPEKKQSGIV